VVRAAEVADGLPYVTSRDEIAEILQDPLFDPQRHGRVAVTEGAVVGWGWIHHHPSGERLERAYLLGTVHPDFRRQGIGTLLFSWQLATARSMLAAYPHRLPRFLRTQVVDTQTDAVALYERHGLTPVRWFEDLLRPLDHLPPLDPPEGVELVGWDPAWSEPARLVLNAAFADHWGSTPTSPEAWKEQLTEHNRRLDLSFLALAAGKLVGVSLAGHFPDDEAVTGRRDGWIAKLGVVREWRGRGVASALIRRSLHAFAAAGFTHAALGVDADNPSGAHRLYRRLGFDTVLRSVVHQLEVEAQ
jgi:mycothiol synthase